MNADQPPRTSLIEDVRLRPPGRGDLAVLEAMVRAYYAEDGLVFDEERQPAALRAIVANDSLVRAWLAEIEGRIVGYVVIALSFSIESGGRDGIIDEIFVVADARNRGLGHRILEMIEDEARSLGLMRLYLEVGHRNRAIGLYRRAGYLARPHYLMSKPL